MSPPRELLDANDVKLLPWYRHPERRNRIVAFVVGGIAIAVLLLVAIIVLATAPSALTHANDSSSWSVFVFTRYAPSMQQIALSSRGTVINVTALDDPMPAARLDASATGWRGRAIVTGGEIDGKGTRRVDIYNARTKTWIATPPMRVAREEHVTAVLEDKLIVCGCDLIEQVSCLHTCETLKLNDRDDYTHANWTVAWSPACAMYSAAVTHDRRMYIIGSWCVGRGREVHVFDGVRWSDGVPLLEERSGHGAAMFAGRIVVCGGSDGPAEQRASCEYFDFTTQRWLPMAKMVHKRNNLEVVVAGGHLVAIGGYSGGNDFLDTIETYDSNNQTWSVATSKLAYPVWKHSAVAVDTAL